LHINILELAPAILYVAVSYLNQGLGSSLSIAYLFPYTGIKHSLPIKII
jgi:hypothetical protein